MSKVKYVILDIETTGLDELNDAILEVGAIAVDADLNVVGTVDFVVRPRPSQLESMNDFCRKMHTDNGLLEVVQDGLDPHDADEELACWLRYSLECEDRSVVIAGHSIAFDHKFLKAQFPLTAKLLHYRTLDSSVPAQLMRDVGFDLGPKPEMPHRAMADCLLEYDELKALITVMKEACTALRYSNSHDHAQAEQDAEDAAKYRNLTR